MENADDELMASTFTDTGADGPFSPIEWFIIPLDKEVRHGR